jgi:hypothetical protein
MGLAPERVSRAALVSPAAVAAGPIPRMLSEVALPMLLYRLRPTRESLLRAARPILTEPEDLAVRQLGAIYRYVRLDTGLPRMATEEELRGFREPVAVFASEDDVFRCLWGCRHVPARAALDGVNDYLREFFTRPDLA